MKLTLWGRAYRQTSKTFQNTPTLHQSHTPKEIYKEYTAAQERARKLTKKFNRKVPIAHTVYLLTTKKPSFRVVSELLAKKYDMEISVSVFDTWTGVTDFHTEPGDVHPNVVLYGHTADLIEWYPLDAYTSTEPKEKQHIIHTPIRILSMVQTGSIISMKVW